MNVKPWGKSLEAIKEGNSMTQWKDRVAYAYWRGNPYVDPGRGDLLKCNATEHEEWNTRLYIQVSPKFHFPKDYDINISFVIDYLNLNNVAFKGLG